MTKLEGFKFVARVIVGAGTTTITKSIIDNNVGPGNLFQKVTVGAASVVVGSMASEKARAYTDAQIDAIASAWTNAKSDAPVNA